MSCFFLQTTTCSCSHVGGSGDRSRASGASSGIFCSWSLTNVFVEAEHWIPWRLLDIKEREQQRDYKRCIFFWRCLFCQYWLDCCVVKIRCLFVCLFLFLFLFCMFCHCRNVLCQFFVTSTWLEHVYSLVVWCYCFDVWCCRGWYQGKYVCILFWSCMQC